MQKTTQPRSYRHSMLCLYTRIVWLTLGAAMVGAGIMMTVPSAKASRASGAKRLGATTRLEDLLNPDGTLNSQNKFVGSIDVRGWRLVNGPDEAPRFAPAGVPGDDAWAPYFRVGADGPVFVLAADGSGNWYVGGNFTTVANNIGLNNIAKWDGASWSALGSGTDGFVSSLAVDGSNNVYAGGGFFQAGGNTVNFIAKWDGSSWSALGYGVNGLVNVLAVDKLNNVYVGGNFGQLCGNVACNMANTTVNSIAKWSGSSWSTLDGGVNSTVAALTVDSGNNVYAGGYFTLAGGSIVNRIAEWNGTSWSALSYGVNAGILALTVDGSDHVYAGGAFTEVCGNAACDTGNSPASHIVEWTGGSWSAVGSGASGNVIALAFYGPSTVYAGGYFLQAGGNTVNYIAKWNGSNWSALGGGMNHPVSALKVDGANDLYAGGTFSQAGASTVNYIARWNQSSWSGFGNGLNSSVNALAVNSAGNVYAGGVFTQVNGIRMNHVAQWNGSYWSTLGYGLNGSVFALTVDGNNVYAGGAFTQLCANFACTIGAQAFHIARWTGLNWAAMGDGVNDDVNALAVNSGHNLFAGGAFTTVCGDIFCSTTNITVNHIARWNGTDWWALGSGLSDSVSALAVDSLNNVYAGGAFTAICGNADCSIVGLAKNHIAEWNGSSWSGLNYGLNNPVLALAVDSSNNVYAGGLFDQTCGNVNCNAMNVTVHYIAKWNGFGWVLLDNGLPNPVHALAVDSTNNLFAGGYFLVSLPDGSTGNRIARWNGSRWSALGSGVNNGVLALAVRGRALFAGGLFDTAGGKSSVYVGEYFLAQLLLPLIER